MSLWSNYYYSGLQISQTTCSTYQPLHCIGFFYPLMFRNKCYCVFSNCKIRPAVHSQTRVTQAIVCTAFSQFCFKLIPRLLKWTWKLSLYCLFFWLVKSPLTGGGYNIHAQFLGSWVLAVYFMACTGATTSRRLYDMGVTSHLSIWEQNTLIT